MDGAGYRGINRIEVRVMIGTCAICGKIICATKYDDLSGVDIIKTKRHTTVLVHKNCMKERNQNGHIKGKKEQ